MDRGVKYAVEKKNESYKRYIAHPIQESREICNRMRNEEKQIVKQAQHEL